MFRLINDAVFVREWSKYQENLRNILEVIMFGENSAFVERFGGSFDVVEFDRSFVGYGSDEFC